MLQEQKSGSCQRTFGFKINPVVAPRGQAAAAATITMTAAVASTSSPYEAGTWRPDVATFSSVGVDLLATTTEDSLRFTSAV